MSKKQIFYFLLAYIAIRVFSFFFHPGPVDSIVSAGILLTAIYFLLKRSEYGWYIIAAEIILGGTEGFLEINGISLRTMLLISATVIFIGQKIKDKKVRETINANKSIFSIIMALYVWLAYATLNGWLSGHAFSEIKTDIIPYLFLFYFFPLVELLRSEKFKNIVFNLLAAAIFGNLIFIIFTFVGYSSGMLHLQDVYYHWFRDVANGKITDFDFNFYRIVLNEQLLLIPLFLMYLNSVLSFPRSSLSFPRKRESSRQTIWIPIFMGMTLLILLAINFTRAYILALAIGLLFLFSKKLWKKWLAYSVATMAIFFLSFTAIHLAASRGQSLGWEFFGIRLQSIAMPQIEDSSLSRLILLPKILDKIHQSPLFGNGLGDTVTVTFPYSSNSPAVILYSTITTPQFDWGYLEIIDELGIVGMALWMLFIFFCFNLIKATQPANKKGLTASLIALLVINITSPALFHVMGIIWITAVISQTKSSRVLS